ncbi:MAG: DUF2752 domain-containing protein [Acutalibacteraceae bacterium]
MNKCFFNKRTFINLIFIFCYLGVISVLYYFRVPCVFDYLFHIPCPGCGMTRAVISAINFDFVTAFRYHPMFWSLPVIFLYLIADGNLFDKKADKVIIFGILAGFLINWTVKIAPIVSAWF